MASRNSVTWRYLPDCRVQHAISIDDAADELAPALCGKRPRSSGELTARRRRRPLVGGWYGTGSQTEYERMQTLPECRRCAERLAK